jgi:hypothetical protein
VLFERGSRFVVAGIVGCALVVLGAAGAAAAKPQSVGSGEVTLTVTFSGSGTGVVTSTPHGIDCAAVCSIQLPVNTSVQLKAQSVGGSMFAAPFLTVSGSDCGTTTHGGQGANTCQTLLTDDTTVQATFNTKPPPCIAPGVTYTNLSVARQLIKNSHCTVGKITYAFSKSKTGRVLAQNPKAHWHLENGAIDLVVSEGHH